MALRADGPGPRETGEERTELESLREQANDLQERGLWNDEALRVNRAIVDLAPGDFEATTRLGRCLQGAGSPCEAVALFDTVLASDPGDNVAQELRGAAAAECELEREVDRLEKEGGLEAIREAASAAGTSLRDLRFTVLARQRIADREPSGPSIGELAAAFAGKGEIHTAEALFRRSLDLDPEPLTNAGSMLGFAALLSEVARDKEALEVCERFVAALPDDVRGLKAITGVLTDLAEKEREHARLTEANAYADRIWLQGIQDESVKALYERMQRIHAAIV